MRNWFLLLLSLVVMNANAQDVHPCGQVHATEDALARHPYILEDMVRAAEELEEATQEAYLNGESDAQREDVYIIPVVFHIIHNNGPENISDEQVIDAINILNRDFRMMNEDIVNVVSAFQDITADIQIEFRLAQLDPQGNCTKGITRIQSELTYEGGSDMKSLIQWPRNKYMNVWVCAYAQGAAGYTFKPNAVNSPWMADEDGIVLKHDYTGSIGTGSIFRSRTLTHEVGHWLNLDHCWGGSNEPGLSSNCGMDDGVSDTPPTIGWTSCVLDGESCGSLDNVQNYMEYSYCSRMFTQGQRTRMRTAATNSIAQRNQLITQNNHIATGILNDEPVLCDADFSVPRRVVCVGEEVQFNDESYNGVSYWNWNFGDANNLEGDDPAIHKDPVHIYSEPGIYTVSLTAGNSMETINEVKQDFIRVLAPGEMVAPIVQGFEAEFPASDWFVSNQAGDEGFEVSTETSYTDSKSIRLQNFYVGEEGTKDAFETSTLDATPFEAVVITYRWAYANRSNETDDRLKISISTDCGANWILKKLHRGFTSLPTAPTHNNYFVPNGPDEWDYNEVWITAASQLTENFRVQFEFEAKGGNNLFIDDINIYGVTPTGLEEIASNGVNELVVFPNPATNEATISFELLKAGIVSARMIDITGRQIMPIMAEIELAQGQHQIPVNLANLAQGIYLIEVQYGDARRIVRLAVE